MTGKRTKSNTYSPDLLVNILIEAVNELVKLYPITSCVTGKPGYPPKAVVVIVALCEYWTAGYRKVHLSLRANRSLLEKLGLVTIPSKTTIGNTYQKIPESYLHKLTGVIIGHIHAGNVAGDATGM